MPPARRTVPPAAAAAAAEERGGNRLAQGNYFGGHLVERIAEATPASHLTQGRSNEDIPVKQSGCFNNKATRSSHINWDMPSPTRANVDAKNLSAILVRFGSVICTQQTRIFPEPLFELVILGGSERRDMSLNFPNVQGAPPQVLHNGSSSFSILLRLH